MTNMPSWQTAATQSGDALTNRLALGSSHNLVPQLAWDGDDDENAYPLKLSLLDTELSNFLTSPHRLNEGDSKLPYTKDEYTQTKTRLLNEHKVLLLNLASNANPT